jgi:RHS repeat-associated protein
MYFDSMNANNPRQSPCVRDSAGLVCVLENALREIFEPWREITGLKLDALGRVVADTNGLGYYAQHTYGANIETVTDRNLKITSIVKDALGRVVRIIAPGENGQTYPTDFTYKVQLDGTQRDSIHHPDDTWEVTVTDKGGRTIQKLDKRGVTQSFVYGNDWNIDTLRYVQSGTPTLAIAYKRNSQGKTTSAERLEGNVVKTRAAYGYDLAGRIVADTQTVNGVSRITTRTFDDANRLVTLTLPNGTTTTRHADVEGRLASVDMDGNAIATLGYSGNIQTTTNYGNGLVGSVGHDLAGRPTGTKWNDASANLLIGDTLAWDNAGRLKASVRMDAATQSQTYGMDNEGQLKEWKTGIPNASNEIFTPIDSLGWAMDSRGNWTSVTQKVSTIDTRTFNGANEILTRNGTALTYTDAGQMLTDGLGRTFTWTLDGMLEGMSLPNGNQVTYQYDSQKRLAARTEKNSFGAVVNLERYTWSGWQITQEERSNGETRNFAFNDYVDNAFAVKVTGGATPGTFYYHRALNYTVNAITNASGAIVEGYKVQPYGSYTVVLPGADGKLGTADDIAQASSSISNDRVWQGLQYDNGMYLVRHRVMHTGMGVWLSKDPAKADPNDYRVMGGMPMSYVDPWGLFGKNTGSGSFTIDYSKKDQPPQKGMSIAIAFVPKCNDCDDSYFIQRVTISTEVNECGDAPYIDPCPEKGGNPNDPRFDSEGKKYLWGLQDERISYLYEIGGLYMDDAPMRNWVPGLKIKWHAETEAWCVKDGKKSSMGVISWGFSVDEKGNITASAK